MKNSSNNRLHKDLERRSRSFNRQSGIRQPNVSILIVCEGEKTEPNYFSNLRDFLKLPIITVRIVEEGGAPISVVEKAIVMVDERKQEHKYNENIPLFESVWCVIDTENPNDNSSLPRAIDIALQKGYHLAISNPSFEYWYILHFEPTTRPFTNGQEAKKYLKKHIEGYDSAKQVFPVLCSKTKNALEFCERTFQSSCQNSKDFPNPSTFVFLLVRLMLSMSRMSDSCFDRDK
jgi:hypothetical protein